MGPLTFSTHVAALDLKFRGINFFGILQKSFTRHFILVKNIKTNRIYLKVYHYTWPVMPTDLSTRAKNILGSRNVSCAIKTKTDKIFSKICEIYREVHSVDKKCLGNVDT